MATKMKSDGPDQYLFVEKYRPQTVSDCILPSTVKDRLDLLVTEGSGHELGHMLFTGTAGVGKTTVAKALCNQLGLDMLMINASEDGNIDTLRTKIRQFASTVSLQDSGYKVVIMDECLDQDECVRVGTVDDWKPVKLRDFAVGVQYPIVSYNMETGEFENDVGEIISDKDDMVYEVTMDNGKTICVTDNHPFIVRDSDGNVFEMTIRDGLLTADVDVIECP